MILLPCVNFVCVDRTNINIHEIPRKHQNIIIKNVCSKAHVIVVVDDYLFLVVTYYVYVYVRNSYNTQKK